MAAARRLPGTAMSTTTTTMIRAMLVLRVWPRTGTRAAATATGRTSAAMRLIRSNLFPYMCFLLVTYGSTPAEPPDAEGGEDDSDGGDPYHEMDEGRQQGAADGQA